MRYYSLTRYAFILTLLLSSSLGVPRQTVFAQASLDSVQVERVATLGELWTTIKYFHPQLAYRDLNWDSALVDVMPRVLTATDSAAYRQAVEDMLAAVGDPATRIVSAQPVADPPPAELVPMTRWTSDSLLIVTLNRETLGFDFRQALSRLQQARSQFGQAQGVLFDTRAEQPYGNLDMLLSWAQFGAFLASQPLTTPGERRRMHMGYAPQRGATSGGYYSAFYTQDGKRTRPQGAGLQKPVAFLVNEVEGASKLALALQASGRAAIVSEGSLDDRMLVATHPVMLSDGLVVQVRLSELIHLDGTTGVAPNVRLAPEEYGEEALARSLALLRDFAVTPVARPAAVPAAAPSPDHTYSDMTYPSVDYRVLAAIRIWGTIEHFFPYHDLMESDWDEVFRRYLPRFVEAEDAQAYHLTVAEMYTHIQDTHGFIRSPVLRDYQGAAATPLYVRWVEEQAVVVGFRDEQAAHEAGIQRGDVILEVDGEPVEARMKRYTKYIAASTPDALTGRAVDRMLFGPDGSTAQLVIQNQAGIEKTVNVPRSQTYGQGFTYRSDDVLQRISDTVGYADLDRLTQAQVPELFERFADTEAIIFDMRGYPNGTAWAIAPYLTETSQVGAAKFDRPMRLGPDAFGRQTFSFTQQIPPTMPYMKRYTGKTVMLIDDRTISQAEHTGLFFEAANGTVFIGSNSNGANGDVTNFSVPGGISLNFTGQSVRHADGRQLQRVGLEPHVEVRPTIEGIRDGKDEVLEAAIQYLKEQ